jgi:hypothetical protein
MAVKSYWSASRSSGDAKHIFDPYYDWAKATNFAYYGSADWLPVLLELGEPKGREFAEQVFMMREQDWAALIRIPPVYRNPPKRFVRPTPFLTAMVRRQFLDRLYGGDDPAKQIRRFEVGRAVNLPEKMAGHAGWGEGKPGSKDVPSGKVVVGVIDDGIAFAHDRFRDGPASTRIHYYWDQLVPSPSPGSWDYGREISKHDTTVGPGIDTRLASSADEDALYRGAGYLDYSQPGVKPLARRACHGTHVMDLACNPASTPGMGPIIAVQLPISVVEDTSLAGLAPQVYDALMYMIDRADRIAAANLVGDLPLVVNLSFGMLAGPHDGSGAVEQAIRDALAACNINPKKPTLQVVLPAGNSHLARGHAEFSLKASAPPKELRWRVQPDDRTESFLEIWYPDRDSSNGSSALEIRITTPTGDVTPFFDAASAYAWTLASAVVGWAEFYPAAVPGGCRLIKLSLAPTADPDRAVPLAPAGVWKVEVRNAGEGQVRDIHAWIQRDDTPFGYPRRGRQSYFDDLLYFVFDDGGRYIESDGHALTSRSDVHRRGTLNAIATGSEPLVVAGLRRSDWKPARYSASGPAVKPARGGPHPDGPDIATISEDSPSHHGLLAAGSRSGSCVAMYGTSVAAPQLARSLVEDLATGGSGGRPAAAKFVSRPNAPPRYNEQDRPPAIPAGSRPTAERGGAGRMELPPVRLPRTERT